MPESKTPAKVEKMLEMCFLKTPKDSKILEIKMGLCERAQGRILVYVTAERAKRSLFLAQKLNPQTIKESLCQVS